MMEHDHAATPPPRRRALRALVIVLLVAILALGAGAAWVAWAMGGSAEGEPVAVEVEEGDTAVAIARRLEEAGVVRSASVFRLVARLRGVSTDFKPGVYELRAGLGVGAAIERLQEGVPKEVDRFTVPEGKTVRETAQIIGRQTHVTEKAFLDALLRARDLPEPLAQKLGERGPTRPEDFEGFLFPETYDIFADATADDVVRIMLRQFERETADLDIAAGARARGLTPYELMIVASLVEKEARCREDLIEGDAPCADDHAKIASVVYNRIERGMRLQIDATIQYVYIQRTGRAKNPLTFADYELRSPYNTYRIDGLPPTPIAAPGAESIRAALRPADTDFFFYRLCDPQQLARGHVFGRTLAERDATWRRECS